MCITVPTGVVDNTCSIIGHIGTNILHVAINYRAIITKIDAHYPKYMFLTFELESTKISACTSYPNSSNNH